MNCNNLELNKEANPEVILEANTEVILEANTEVNLEANPEALPSDEPYKKIKNYGSADHNQRGSNDDNINQKPILRAYEEAHYGSYQLMGNANFSLDRSSARGKEPDKVSNLIKDRL